MRPSSELRETYQYNNLMYQTLPLIPQHLLGQPYESFVAEHIFGPLNMTSSTYSVAEAEKWGTLANAFQTNMRFADGTNATNKPVVPFYQRPGQENVWAGAGGVLTSARDLVSLISVPV